MRENVSNLISFNRPLKCKRSIKAAIAQRKTGEVWSARIFGAAQRRAPSGLSAWRLGWWRLRVGPRVSFKFSYCKSWRAGIFFTLSCSAPCSVSFCLAGWAKMSQLRHSFISFQVYFWTVGTWPYLCCPYLTPKRKFRYWCFMVSSEKEK